MSKQQFILILLIFIPMLGLSASAQKTKSPTTQITYDVYFQGYFLGDTLTVVNEEGEAVAIDTTTIIEHLPAYLEKVGISDHPLQKNKYLPSMMNLDACEKQLDLILRIDSSQFRTTIELPPRFKPLRSLPLETNDANINIIEPAHARAWFDLSGNILLYNPSSNASLASWRGGFALQDWHVYANGIFDDDPVHFLQNWRVEKSIWKERITRFQLGWTNLPSIINGQLIAPNLFGTAISNSLNRILDSAILKELPGGILELRENSRVDIFTNGLLIRSDQLNAGKYHIRDLSIDPSLNTVDVRVTTESGRQETTRLNLYSFPKQPEKGAVEYLFYFGLQANNQWAPSIGGTIYRGFGAGLAMGIHHTWMHLDGYRLGFFLEKNLPQLRFDFSAWWQSRNLDAGQASIDGNLNFPQLLGGLSSRFSINLYNQHAMPYERQLEASVGFSTKIYNIDIAQINLGFLREVSQKQGFFVRISRSFLLWNNFSASISINMDTLRNNTQAIFSLSLTPISNLSEQYSQDILNYQALRFTANAYLPEDKIRFMADYSHARNTGLSSLTLMPSWDTDLVAIRANASFAEQIRGQFHPNQISVAFQTGLLFADNSFAITSNPNETFAIVDASALPRSLPLTVKIQNRNVRSFNKRYGLTGLMNFRQNSVDIDASQSGYGYASHRETISPKPGQAFRILLENKGGLVATGTLRFPNLAPVSLMHGKLTHARTKENARWYTGEDGVFAFEGRTGIWHGIVYIDDKQYSLQINLNESDNIEGALFLGDIFLQEMK